MEKKRIWRAVFVSLLVVFALAYVMPTMVGPDRLPDWYPFKKSLKFGLDLQGGLELRYTVDYKKAVQEMSRDLMLRTEEYLARKLRTEERDERPTQDEIEQVRKRVSMSLAGFDTVEIVTADEEIRSLLGRDNLVEEIDSRYGWDASGDTILFVMDSGILSDLRESIMDQSLRTVRKRIDASGLVEPDVRRAGDSDIDVQMPGVKKEEGDRIRDMIGKTARLTFRIVDVKDDFFKDKQPLVDEFISLKGLRADDGTPAIELVSYGGRTQLRARQKSHLVALVQYMREKTVEVEGQSKRVLADDHVIGYYQVNEKGDATRDDQPSRQARLEKTYYRTEYLFAKVSVSGDHVARSNVYFETSGAEINQPFVSLSFSSRGAQLFAELTRDNVNEYLAIMLDDDIHSAPVIKEEIPGGTARISLGGDRPGDEMIREAYSLVAVLDAGAYKAPLHKLQDNEVGPTLGQDAIDAGILSMVVGLLLVVAFMAAYYQMSGLVANFCLILNLLFMLAVLVAFNSALTLPGLAGFVLTLGMAVDANVIIFERIREELRAGKMARTAIETGFEKSRWTILDSQFTTALAAVILLNFTTGPVYGFAVTLLVGIVCSLFTALFISKMVFDWLLNKKIISSKVSI
jgi:preprotein translocase subunit SecD